MFVYYNSLQIIFSYPGYQRFSKRIEPWSDKKRREKERRWENLWLPTTVDWSNYCTNIFELGFNTASWLEEPYSILWFAVVNWQVCVMILVTPIIGLPTTRSFLLPLLSLPSLHGKRNLWDQGNIFLQIMEIISSMNIITYLHVPCDIFIQLLWATHWISQWN